MKNIIKLIALLLVFIFAMSVVGFNSSCIETGEMDTATNETAIDADEDVFYGIFTEDYRIGYRKDSKGNIIMDNDSFKQLYALSNDITCVKHILDCKASADENINISKAGTSVSTVNSVLSNIKSISPQSMNLNRVLIAETNDTQTLENLTNFRSYIKPHKAYKSKTSDEGFRLVLKYAWFWTYQPAFTFTDAVAVGWSDQLDAVTDETDIGGSRMQFNYYQTGIPAEYFGDVGVEKVTKQRLKLRGNDCFTRVGLSSMFQTDFDIKRTFNHNGETYQVTKHWGSMYVVIGREVLDGFDNLINYTGNFYHQVIKPNASISFDGEKLSLSSAAQLRYDEAIPAYNSTTYSKILEMINS